MFRFSHIFIFRTKLKESLEGTFFPHSQHFVCLDTGETKFVYFSPQIKFSVAFKKYSISAEGELDVDRK